MTVAFNQAAAFVDVRVLEYSGLDTTSPLDVTAGAAGTGTSGEQRGGDDDLGERVDFWSGHDGGRRSRERGRGSRPGSLPVRTADIAEDKIGEQHGQLQCDGDR